MSTSPGRDASPAVGPARAVQPSRSRRPSQRLTSPLARARVSVSLLAVSYGVMVGGWSSRVPDIRAAVGADERTWGLVNTVEVGVGLVAAVVMVGLISRLNTRRLAVVSSVVLLVDAPLMAASTTLGVLIAGAVVWGMAGNLHETPAQALQLDLQQSYGRPLIGSFAACWNFGSFAGAGMGIGAAALGLPPGIQLGGCSLVLGAFLFAVRRWVPDAPRRPASTAKRRWVRDRLNPQLLLLTLISFLTAYMVSAGEQWSAIYTSQTLGAGAVLGAATYTGWVLANAIGLLAVDRLTARVGLLRFFRVSMVIAAAALALALALATPAAAIAGFVLLGLCTIGIAPLLNGLAAQQTGLTPGEALSVVQLGQPPGFLLSPALIGLVAGGFGLHIALTTVVAALLLAALLATRLRPFAGSTA